MVTVACQGAEGSFSHLAGKRFFREPFTLIETTRFKDIFQAVAEGRAAHGIVPIENSLVGSLYETYDLLCHYQVPIRGEVYLRIEHHLLALPDDGMPPRERLRQIIRVLSHPKALEQCRLLFEDYQHLRQEPFSDTAGAARFVAHSGDFSLAAIASREAADRYGLSVLLADIEDDRRNYTRFLVVGKPVISTWLGPTKVSFVATLQHRPGSLLSVLSLLYEDGADLTKIESRPIVGRPFEYLFYFDVIHPGGAAALERGLQAVTTSLRILGEYESAPLPHDGGA